MIANDFSDRIDKQMLESNSRITLSHHPHIIYELQVANENKISSGQNFFQHAKS